MEGLLLRQMDVAVEEVIESITHYYIFDEHSTSFLYLVSYFHKYERAIFEDSCNEV